MSTLLDKKSNKFASIKFKPEYKHVCQSFLEKSFKLLILKAITLV